jgi:hypothetical protein
VKGWIDHFAQLICHKIVVSVAVAANVAPVDTPHVRTGGHSVNSTFGTYQRSKEE